MRVGDNIVMFQKKEMDVVTLEDKKKCLEALNHILESVKHQAENPPRNIHKKPFYYVVGNIKEAFTLQYRETMLDMALQIEDVISSLPLINECWNDYSKFVRLVTTKIFAVTTECEFIAFYFDKKGALESFVVNGKDVWAIIFEEMVKTANISDIAFFCDEGHAKINKVYGINKDE